MLEFAKFWMKLTNVQTVVVLSPSIKNKHKSYSKCSKYSFTKTFHQNSQNYKGKYNKRRVFVVVLQN